MSTINANSPITNIDLSIAIPCRDNTHGDFYAVPKDDGGYTLVKVWNAQMSATEKRNAFDIHVAHDAYVAQQKVEADRKAEVEARKANRVKAVSETTTKNDASLKAFIRSGSFTEPMNATMVKGAVAEFADVTVMAVGSALHRAVDNGLLTEVKVEGDNKTYYKVV